METVLKAIHQDGIAFARVPTKLIAELNRYGGEDAIDMLKFRVSCHPRDTSSWKILEVCLLAVVQRFNYRLEMAKSIASARLRQVTINEKIEMNVFRDLLITLLKRAWMSYDELYVLSLSFNLQNGNNVDIIELEPSDTLNPQYRHCQDCSCSMLGFRISISSTDDLPFVFVQKHLLTGAFAKYFTAIGEVYGIVSNLHI
jgi:hypothetical protein